MKKSVMLAVAGSLVLAACGDKASKSDEAASNVPPEKRQPGSWSQKIDIVKLEGADVTPESKAQMQQMFSALSAMTVCLTPEAAAQEDMAEKLSQTGANGESCTFEKKNFSGRNIEFAATCKDPTGKSVQMSAKGTSGGTAQDITMTIVSNKADGSQEGEMVMRLVAERKGECGPNDITPPTPVTKG